MNAPDPILRIRSSKQMHTRPGVAATLPPHAVVPWAASPGTPHRDDFFDVSNPPVIQTLIWVLI